MSTIHGGLIIAGIVACFLAKLVIAWYHHDIKGENDGRWNSL